MKRFILLIVAVFIRLRLSPLLLILLMSVILFLSAASAQMPPNGSLEVAYRQSDEGKLSDSVHLLNLWCLDGRCSLTTVTVNQCLKTGEGDGFYPKAERTSTDEKSLVLTEIQSGVLLVEERHSLATFKYQFLYTTRDSPDLSKTLGARTTRYFQGLTGFSGSVIKTSVMLGKVISWDVVPIRGMLTLIQPKCKIAVFGVPQ